MIGTMMEMEQVTLRLPPDMIDALRRIARAGDVTVGQIIRDAIAQDLSRRGSAKTPNRADERLVASLRSLLATDLADAETWQDLQSRLIARGYRLAEAGGGLVLLRHPCGERLCKGSELGYGYSQLVRRFRSPFPGHPHVRLAERVLSHDQPNR